LAGLLILEKSLPLLNGHPNRFILTNGKHPITPLSIQPGFPEISVPFVNNLLPGSLGNISEKKK